MPDKAVKMADDRVVGEWLVVLLDDKGGISGSPTLTLTFMPEGKPLAKVESEKDPQIEQIEKKVMLWERQLLNDASP